MPLGKHDRCTRDRMPPGRGSLPPRPHRPPSPSPPGARRSLAGIRRGLTPRNTKKRRHRRAAPVAEANEKEIRLSATDISALASMKNVAKCDTWCELQNPVNHRVFERKLRPRDPPEGTPASWALEAHPRSVASRQRRGHWPSEPRGAVGLSVRPSYAAGSGELWATARVAPGSVPTQGLVRPPNEEHAVALRGTFGPIPQVRRGYPPSLSI